MTSNPSEMCGVVLTGHGGLDKLEFRTDLAVPRPETGEVLVRVAAAGVNNTDINTRIGWYSKAVTEGTDAGGSGASGSDDVDAADASWTGAPLVFPRIQGADATGRIVAVGEGVADARVGERVLCRAVSDTGTDPGSYEAWTLGSERDGAFAQFVTLPAVDAFVVDTELTDLELAALPCAYSTAEGMLHRIGLEAERVLITGASGGVGGAAIQLAKLRGARVVAVASASKAQQVLALGADVVVDRGAPLLDQVDAGSFDVVVDLVAGPAWPDLLDALRRGGRYITAGAIAGPIVELDVRTLYLRDLTLAGSTHQPREVFEQLVSYVNAGSLRPTVAATFPLAEIRAAQELFLSKRFVGKIVLEVG